MKYSVVVSQKKQQHKSLVYIQVNFISKKIIKEKFHSFQNS